jgi:hypothetical protein
VFTLPQRPRHFDTVRHEDSARSFVDIRYKAQVTYNVISGMSDSLFESDIPEITERYGDNSWPQRNHRPAYALAAGPVPSRVVVVVVAAAGRL